MIGGTLAPGPVGATDPSAATARVAQLEALIREAASPLSTTSAPTGTDATTTTATNPGGNFAAMLASASATGTGAAGGNDYSAIIAAAAHQYGIDPAVLEGLVHQESGFNPNAVSSAGAEGLTQVMPENFAADGITNPFDATQSIYGGAKQLSEDLSEFGGNVTDALAAYNAGSAAVQRYGGVPPYAQTQNYVTSVLDYAQQWAAANGAASASPVAPGSVA
jgi:soluble lytic murein transglycosylase-like protein